MKRQGSGGGRRFHVSDVQRPVETRAVATVAEGRRLLEAFRSIVCPQVRNRVLDYVLSEAQRQAPSGLI